MLDAVDHRGLNVANLVHGGYYLTSQVGVSRNNLLFIFDESV
jgi:hypothetical protein